MPCNVRTVAVAGQIMSVSDLPLWSVAAVALAGLAFFFAAVLHVLPPALRQRYLRVMVLVALIFLLPVLGSREPRGLLWLAGMFGSGMAVGLWWLGPMPADVPSAQNAAAYQHPQYATAARRGRVAASAGLVLAAGLCIGSVMFIGGV